MGGWCGKFSNFMRHPTKSNYMGGWYFAAWKGKKEYHQPNLAKRKRRALQNTAETTIFVHVYAQSSNLRYFGLTVKVVPKFILFYLLWLYCFNLLYGTLSLL